MNTNEINEGSMLRVNTILRGAYRIVRYLSSGGFGNTYVAVNQFDETVAVKEFYMRGVNTRGRDNKVQIAVPTSVEQFKEQLDKFRKEAYRLRKLRNEHIVAVHDMFSENGTYYYVMDYINGESVGDRLRRTNTPLSESESLLYFFHIVDALKEVHGKGFFHLDIKPANILVENKLARLIDFGASKQMLARGGATRTAMCYTPGYAPSEQVDQQLENFGAWTDIYALGATLYSMLTASKPPMSGDIIEQGDSAFHFRKETSKAVRQLVIAMMKPARRQRPQSVKDLYALAAKLGIKEPTEEENVVEAIVDVDEVEVVDDEPAAAKKTADKVEPVGDEPAAAKKTADKVKRINVKQIKERIEKSKGAKKEPVPEKKEKQEAAVSKPQPVASKPSTPVKPQPAVSKPQPAVSKPSTPVKPQPAVSKPSAPVQPKPAVSKPSAPVQLKPAVSKPSAPVQPKPATPIGSTPSRPQPSKPFQPFQPSPSQPQPGKPFQPQPSQPQAGKPFQPQPSQPQPGKPFQPSPSQPQPGKPFQPQPSQPQAGKPFQPSPSQPQAGKPFQPSPSQPQAGKPFQPSPSQPQPGKPFQPSPSQPQAGMPFQPSPSQPQPGKPFQPQPSQPQPSQRGPQPAPYISQPVRPKQNTGYEVRKPVVVAPQQPRPDPEAGRVKYETNEKKGNSKIVIGSIIAAAVLVLLTVLLMVKCAGSTSSDVTDDGLEINRVSNLKFNEFTYYDDDNNLCRPDFKYSGNVKDGRPHGKGTGQYETNGDGQYDDGEYEGTYDAGLRDGENGTYSITSGTDSGDTFKGEFKKDMFHKGEYYDNSADQTFKGTFRSNKPYNGVWLDKSNNTVATVTNGVRK